MSAADRGRDTTRALTEVRTVLSRAEAALRYPNVFEGDGEGDEMVAALEHVVEILAKWRRTGRPTMRCEWPRSVEWGPVCSRPQGHVGACNKDGWRQRP